MIYRYNINLYYCNDCEIKYKIINQQIKRLNVLQNINTDFSLVADFRNLNDEKRIL